MVKQNSTWFLIVRVPDLQQSVTLEIRELPDFFWLVMTLYGLSIVIAIITLILCLLILVCF